ncbi:hypothetical protein SUGI_0388240 [Cryptomeria japonica]|nr:hypothetical protein SUGI_0388240 [Cryptomeria japonica]
MLRRERTGGLRHRSTELFERSDSVFSQQTQFEDDKEALYSVAIEKLPTYNRYSEKTFGEERTQLDNMSAKRSSVQTSLASYFPVYKCL